MPKYDIGRYVEPFYRSHQTVSGGRSVVVDLRDGAVVDDNDGNIIKYGEGTKVHR